jgi:hypothetical protein
MKRWNVGGCATSIKPSEGVTVLILRSMVKRGLNVELRKESFCIEAYEGVELRGREREKKLGNPGRTMLI